MAYKIGFTSENHSEKDVMRTATEEKQSAMPKKSVVQVHFAKRHLTCSYYNDRFDLHKGDIVYVEGKLEGMRGIVVDVAYSFKIKLSDYKRVISVADTYVKGRFYSAGTHFVTVDENAVNYEKVIGWFRAPENPEDEYVFGEGDENTFSLSDLSGMNITKEAAERGRDYYLENNVVYFELSGGHGRAIVEGSEFYTVEFGYNKGEISNITCGCYCGGTCKHEFAAMLQLKDTLSLSEKNYPELVTDGGYFAAISKSVLFEYAVDGKTQSSFTLG